jgi:hypothetical protein
MIYVESAGEGKKINIIIKVINFGTSDDKYKRKSLEVRN